MFLGLELHHNWDDLKTEMREVVINTNDCSKEKNVSIKISSKIAINLPSAGSARLQVLP